MISKDEVLNKLDYKPEDGCFFWKTTGKMSGWIDQYGYRLTRINGRLCRDHHLVWLVETGKWPESEIDHKNNDPGDNRFDNLRPANRHQQGANQTLQKRRKGKYKGVYQMKSGKYYVKIKHRGKQNYLGSYHTEEEAALVYNQKALELFGEFANLNEVGD